MFCQFVYLCLRPKKFIYVNNILVLWSNLCFVTYVIYFSYSLCMNIFFCLFFFFLKNFLLFIFTYIDFFLILFVDFWNIRLIFSFSFLIFFYSLRNVYFYFFFATQNNFLFSYCYTFYFFFSFIFFFCFLFQFFIFVRLNMITMQSQFLLVWKPCELRWMHCYECLFLFFCFLFLVFARKMSRNLIFEISRL